MEARLKVLDDTTATLKRGEGGRNNLFSAIRQGVPFNLSEIVALKHVIWRLPICNYFCEMFKFRDFMNTSRNFAKSVFVRIFAKFKYLAKQFILTESPDHLL